jgi:superfamily I DNA/RNA helicase
MQHSLSKYLMLNTDQKAVVDAPLESNIVVIAGAGSGKTTTILRRIEVMVKERGVLPSEILLTTFTVEATKDIKSRIGIDGIQIGTIDAISRGVLQSKVCV